MCVGWETALSSSRFLAGELQAAIPSVVAGYMWPRKRPLSGVEIGLGGAFWATSGAYFCGDLDLAIVTVGWLFCTSLYTFFKLGSQCLEFIWRRVRPCVQRSDDGLPPMSVVWRQEKFSNLVLLCPGGRENVGPYDDHVGGGDVEASEDVVTTFFRVLV
jgi:hypothetical protein